jgi:hypothetical protein
MAEDVGAVQDARYHLSKMRIAEGESIEDFARRRYYMQMEVYSSWAGRDLDVQFEFLDGKVQKDWIKSAKQAVEEAKSLIRGNHDEHSTSRKTTRQ